MDADVTNNLDVPTNANADADEGFPVPWFEALTQKLIREDRVRRRRAFFMELFGSDSDVETDEEV